MQTEDVAFTNSRGRKLAARLDRPDGAAHAFALFAHCFTCDKTSKAAVRISRALAGLGLATLRFDFTGLGESEGELTGFSADVQDLIDAAAYMAGRGMAPALLVGHSLGGTAALAAAGDIASVKAVTVIGSPAEPAHVLKLFGADLAAIERDGEGQVRIGGRPFTVRRDFVDDARMHDLKARIHALRRALLILHSPIDNIVGVENATEIFLAARHSKSFVSLDTADHLLTKNADADYAADVIAAWASRYVGAAAHQAALPPENVPGAGVLVQETGAGKFQVEARVRGTPIVADEPADVGGLGSGPSPYELVSAGLGACTSMTVRLYAERKGWPLLRTRVVVSHEKVDGQTPPDVFHRKIGFEGPLDAEQRARLLEIAEKCPVHRTLEAGSRVETTALPAHPPPPAPAAVAAEADDHFREMDEACRDAGAPA
jgi:putative redox protein